LAARFSVAATLATGGFGEHALPLRGEVFIADLGGDDAPDLTIQSPCGIVVDLARP
jgi:hypothetical protein